MRKYKPNSYTITRQFPSLYPKRWDSIVFYFRSVAANTIPTGASNSFLFIARDSLIADQDLISLVGYFTSYRVEAIKVEVCLAETPLIQEVITSTWDRDTPQYTLGTAVMAGTTNYVTLQELRNVKHSQVVKEVITTKWKMDPSIPAHCEFRNIPANTSATTAVSYLNGGVAVGVQLDATVGADTPAFRAVVVYKVRLSGRKNL